MKLLGILGISVFMIALLVEDGHVSAQMLSATEIMNKMKKVYEPELASDRNVTFLIMEGDTVTREWQAREALKTFQEERKRLLVLLRPDEVKGTAFMIVEKKNKESFSMVYIPAIKRVRKITGRSAYDSFFGTDFTYGDLGFLDIRGTHKLLGEEEHGDTPTYKIETIPQERGAYSSIVTWVLKDSFLPVERDFYDAGNVLWKKKLFEDVTVINNIPTLIRLRILDVQGNTSTERKINEMCYGAAVKDEIFDLKKLPEVLGMPFCEIADTTK